MRRTTICIAAALLGACAQPQERAQPASSVRRVSVEASAAADAHGPCDPARGPVALELVSFTDAGALGRTCQASRPPCKNASHPSISFDGTRVAFDSDAPGMTGDGDPPSGVAQIYLRDIVRGRTLLVSGRTSGGTTTFANANAGFPDLSGDGQTVVFASTASNLVDSDRGGFADVFAANLEARTLERVSERSDGAELDGDSADPTVSEDGRWIVFVSSAGNLAPLFAPGGETPIAGPAGRRMRLYLTERATRRFEWLDRGLGDEANPPEASQPVISADGSVVAFTSSSTPLGSDGSESKLDIYAFAREEGGLLLVSAAFGSQQPADGVSRKPQVSGNGRFIAFEGTASDLIAPGLDTNNQSDVFVRDLQQGLTVRVSVSSSGGQANGTSGYAALSYDGRFVAFSSSARNLVPGDTTRGFLDCFVHDRDVAGDGVFDEPGDICTRRMSTTPTGVQANARSGGNCDLSADGRFLAFMSESNLLHPGDDNGVADKLKCSPTCLFGRDVFRARVY